MSELKVFGFEGKDVRVIIRTGEPWWVLKDVCSALGIANSRDAAGRLDDDEKDDVGIADAIGRKQNTSAISESGLYSVILLSRKPQAKVFKRWITHEVIPSIRKHGAYMTPPTIDELVANPDMLIKLATTLKEEQEARKLALKQLEETSTLLEYKVIELDESKEWFTVKRVAKMNRVPWKNISWKRLKTTSAYLQYDVRKIFDANYGAVNSYHVEVWKQEYPGFNYDAQ
jgi:prophage antirepressor-like protein